MEAKHKWVLIPFLCLCAWVGFGQGFTIRNPGYVASLKPGGGGGGGFTLKDSNNGTTNGVSRCGLVAGMVYTGSPWTAGSSYTLNQLKIKVSKTASMSGLRLGIYSSTAGGFPDPRPNALIGSTVDIADGSISSSEATVTCSGFGASLTSGTVYFIVARNLSGSGSGVYTIYMTAGSAQYCEDDDGVAPWSTGDDPNQPFWYETYQ